MVYLNEEGEFEPIPRIHRFIIKSIMNFVLVKN